VNEGLNIPPRGQISPLVAKGEVKNGPLSTIQIPPSFDPSFHCTGEYWFLLSCGSSVFARVTGRVCEKIAQNVAHAIFV
jgi:hypothetical protein